jgi:hypothetical protein
MGRVKVPQCPIRVTGRDTRRRILASSASPLRRSWVNGLPPALRRRRPCLPRARAQAQSVAGSAAAPIARSTVWARCRATPLNVSIHILHIGQAVVCRVPDMKSYRINARPGLAHSSRRRMGPTGPSKPARSRSPSWNTSSVTSAPVGSAPAVCRGPRDGPGHFHLGQSELVPRPQVRPRVVRVARATPQARGPFAIHGPGTADDRPSMRGGRLLATAQHIPGLPGACAPDGRDSVSLLFEDSGDRWARLPGGAHVLIAPPGRPMERGFAPEARAERRASLDLGLVAEEVWSARHREGCSLIVHSDVVADEREAAERVAASQAPARVPAQESLTGPT